ncbi:alpha/beta hydrolase [Gordonia sp. CPCC 205333]|uniref:alpha/beta hydrolase n=1 Tax=Gordonia sp. CPCC 205333 TaxID=3140790 RepID=UPI003AF3DE2C
MPKSTSLAALSIRKGIIPIHRDEVTLDLHVWRPAEPTAAVFYFHGLQSHAGWLWETGQQFAERGVALFVLDRRGSGTSGGARGVIPDAATSIGDYIAALSEVERLIGEDVPLGLFGHCLGGSFLAALLKSGGLSTRYDAAIFCSTWLGKLHATLSADQLRALAVDEGQEPRAVELAASDFTANTRYRTFIDEDDLAIRALTGQSKSALLQLESIYLAPDTPALTEGIPAAFISGTSDPIIDLDDAQNTFIRLTLGQGEIAMLPTDRHYLLYTSVRDRLISWTSDFVSAARPPESLMSVRCA